MNDLVTINSGTSQTMSSTELLEVVNSARVGQGLEPLRRNVFSARVEDELEGLNYKSFVIGQYDGAPIYGYELDEDQALLVAMRESKFVRRSVLEQLRKLMAANQGLKQELIENQQQQIKQLQSQVKKTPTWDRPEHFCIIEDDTLSEISGIPLNIVDKARKDAISSGEIDFKGDLAIDNRMLGAFSPDGCNVILSYMLPQYQSKVRQDKLNQFFDYAIRAAFRRIESYSASDYRKERASTYWESQAKPLPWQKAVQAKSYPVHDVRLLNN